MLSRNDKKNRRFTVGMAGVVLAGVILAFWPDAADAQRNSTNSTNSTNSANSANSAGSRNVRNQAVSRQPTGQRPTAPKQAGTAQPSSTVRHAQKPEATPTRHATASRQGQSQTRTQSQSQAQSQSQSQSQSQAQTQAQTLAQAQAQIPNRVHPNPVPEVAASAAHHPGKNSTFSGGIAGFLLGGVLGSMVFGSHGTGGFGILDLLLLGVLGYLLYHMLRTYQATGGKRPEFKFTLPFPQTTGGKRSEFKFKFPFSLPAGGKLPGFKFKFPFSLPAGGGKHSDLRKWGAFPFSLTRPPKPVPSLASGRGVGQDLVDFRDDMHLFQDEPGLSRTEPGFSRTEPGFSRTEPGFSRTEPGLSRTEPGFSRIEPGLSRAEPGFSRTEPDFVRDEPDLTRSELQPKTPVPVKPVMQPKSATYSKPGMQPKPAMQPKPTAPVKPMAPVLLNKEPMDAVSWGLQQIVHTDPHFRQDTFLAGACVAFELLQKAWREWDVEQLRPLVTRHMWSLVERQAMEDKKAGRCNVIDKIRFETSTICDVWQESGKSYITVQFAVDMVDYITDTHGRILEGNPNVPIRVEEYWTFVRPVGSPDPNWCLSAIRQPDTDITDPS